MQKTKIIFKDFEKAFFSIKEAIVISEKKKNNNLQEFPFYKDLVIQRFEYTSEISWKLMKKFLQEVHLIDCRSPNECLKKSFEIWIINDLEKWVEIIQTRNILSHNYWELLSTTKYKKILELYPTIENFYETMKKIAK